MLAALHIVIEHSCLKCTSLCGSVIHTCYTCRGFAAEEEKTTSQIRAEIDSHLASKRRVESTLPQSIVIGPFYVNTDSVRLALAKKHKEIARSLLDFLAEQLHKDTEQVQHNYVYSVKVFWATRGVVITVPATVAGIC